MEKKVFQRLTRSKLMVRKELMVGKQYKNFLKASLLIILSIMLSLSSVEGSSVVSSAGSTPIDAADLEIFIGKFMQEQMEKNHITNATVAVVSNGEAILKKGYGYADLSQSTAVDPDKTLFRIGSASKLFTWTAVMQLVEQGKLDLDTDINTYLDFEIPAKLFKNTTKTEPAPITLRHLMTHTAGFEDALDGLFFLNADKALPLREYLITYLPARVFPVGEIMAYSNYGTALAGYIVERVSGMAFAEYVETNIYTPLGMENSTFRQPLPEHLAANMAIPYRYHNGEYLQGDFEFVPEPAGSMSTTASDISKFMLAHLQGGSFNTNRILKKETTQKMHSQQFTHDAQLDGMTLGFIEGTFNNKRSLFHGGATFLFNTGLYLLPEENVGLFVSYSSGTHYMHGQLFQAFLDRYYPAAATLDTALPEGSVNRAKALRGTYLSNRRSFTTSSSILSLVMGPIRIDVDKDGYLLANFYGETYQFVEVSPGVYHNLSAERTQDPFGALSTLVFHTDSLGKTMLMSDGPMTYFKAPWYGSAQFTILVLGISILIVLATLITWTIGFIKGLVKGRKRHYNKIALGARWTVVVFAVLFLLFLLDLGLGNGVDPAYGVPLSLFGILPPWSSLLELFPLFMAALAVPILIFSILAWYNSYWGKLARIHYSIFSTSTLALVWIFYYWNLL